jgi:hypothetical protein
MPLPDFTSPDHPLDILRRRMGAPLLEHLSFGHNMERLTIADLEVMEKEGLDVNIDDVRELPDGTLAYKDSRVLVYIRDQHIFQQRDPREGLPKFHLANCDTLKNMREKNRFGRYVASIRTDGKFEIIFVHNRGERKRAEEELDICKNCLDHLSYNEYRHHSPKTHRDKIFNDFSLKDFFIQYPRSIITNPPTHTSANAPVNDYAPKFGEISRQYRAENNWICKNCRVDLSQPSHRRYLHTHHEDGLRYNNSRENLTTLCIRCHANEPSHSHVRNSPDYTNFLKIYPSLQKSIN